MNREQKYAGSYIGEGQTVISDRTKRMLSEGVSEDGERMVLFLEEGGQSFVFRLFRAREGGEDPERQAVRWLGMATGLCKSTHGELKTGVIPSRDGESAMAAVSGREIEAKEWPPEFADSSRLSTGQAAR